MILGDIFELYNIKLKDGQMIAFSDDCSGAAKRMTGMKVVCSGFDVDEVTYW